MTEGRVLEKELCPSCGAELARDGIDIEVGTVFGSYYCTHCQWVVDNDDLPRK